MQTFLLNANDVQQELARTIKRLRKQQKLSRVALAVRSGVPASTIKKFETTNQISLRQFILLWQTVGNLDKLMGITKKEASIPKSIQDVINHE